MPLRARTSCRDDGSDHDRLVCQQEDTHPGTRISDSGITEEAAQGEVARLALRSVMNENDRAKIELNNRLQEVMEFRATLSEETDRGCALMAASFLDEQLRKLLEMCLVDDPEKEKFFEPQAPLGSFSARITAAFLLGKISKLAFRDLNLIRKIRNEFGHTSRPICFADEPIDDLCREFHYCMRDRKDDPRKRFTNTVMGVLAFIHAGAIKAQKLSVQSEVEQSPEQIESAKTVVNDFVKRELQKIDEQYQNDLHRMLEDLRKDGYGFGESGVS